MYTQPSYTKICAWICLQAFHMIEVFEFYLLAPSLYFPVYEEHLFYHLGKHYSRFYDDKRGVAREVLSTANSRSQVTSFTLLPSFFSSSSSCFLIFHAGVGDLLPFNWLRKNGSKQNSSTWGDLVLNYLTTES
ncbi:hypothetical protein IMY05_004G0151200 [Salix suchowensis]|nr:hypothetical protein IMY05_004G0151200 [Salix suchowensis]